jgi:hypothetical protein
MDVTLGQHHAPTAGVTVPARQTRQLVERTQLSLRVAMALYVAGVLVESFGLALIAAYGWVLVGGAIAGFGLVVGFIGDSRLPGRGVSNVALLMDYVDVARRRQR